jgi:hypothetical protein
VSLVIFVKDTTNNNTIHELLSSFAGHLLPFLSFLVANQGLVVFQCKQPFGTHPLMMMRAAAVSFIVTPSLLESSFHMPYGI